MANNKVQLADGTTLIDLTDTTAVAADVAAGKAFYGADGVRTVGTATGVTEVTISSSGAVTQALDPEKIYHFTGALTSLTITLNVATSGQLAQYHFDFESGSTALTLTLPNTINMPLSFSVTSNHHYEIDIFGTYGIGQEW